MKPILLAVALLAPVPRDAEPFVVRSSVSYQTIGENGEWCECNVHTFAQLPQQVEVILQCGTQKGKNTWRDYRMYQGGGLIHETREPKGGWPSFPIHKACRLDDEQKKESK